MISGLSTYTNVHMKESFVRIIRKSGLIHTLLNVDLFYRLEQVGNHLLKESFRSSDRTFLVFGRLNRLWKFQVKTMPFCAPKGNKLVFQPSIFRCEVLVLGRLPRIVWNYPKNVSSRCCLEKQFPAWWSYLGFNTLILRVCLTLWIDIFRDLVYPWKSLPPLRNWWFLLDDDKPLLK